MKDMLRNDGSRRDYEIWLCLEFDNGNGSGNVLWAFGSRVDYIVLELLSVGQKRQMDRALVW